MVDIEDDSYPYLVDQREPIVHPRRHRRTTADVISHYLAPETIKKSLQSDFSKSVYSIMLDSIRMALALAVALAWNNAIKYTISKIWKSDNANSLIMRFVYAIVITIIFATLLLFARNKLNYEYDVDNKVQFAVVSQ